MNAEQARTAIKSLGEFAGVEVPSGDEPVTLIFVGYKPGARDGRFHYYRHLRVSKLVYAELKNEL